MRWVWIAAAVLQGLVGLGTLVGHMEKPLGRVGGVLLLVSAAIGFFNAFARTPALIGRGSRFNGKWLFWIAAIAGYGLGVTFQIPLPKNASPAGTLAMSSTPARALKPSSSIADAKKAQADAAAAKARAAAEKTVVGRWLHPMMGIYIIKKTADGYALLVEDNDGTSIMAHLKKHRSAKGLRLDNPNSEDGDYLIILPDGRLDLRDKDGEIITLEPALGETPAVRAEELSALNARMRCSSDINCVVKDNLAADEPACKQSIEARAKWDFKWTGWGSIFSGYRFSSHHPSSDAVIDYYGDELEFQNGFGAWMNMIYVCTVDTKKNTVVKVVVGPGHLRN